MSVEAGREQGDRQPRQDPAGFVGPIVDGGVRQPRRLRGGDVDRPGLLRPSPRDRIGGQLVQDRIEIERQAGAGWAGRRMESSTRPIPRSPTDGCETLREPGFIFGRDADQAGCRNITPGESRVPVTPAVGRGIRPAGLGFVAEPGPKKA